MDIKTKERFWSKVERGESNECWPWKASTLRGGYGYFYLDGTKQAHRMAYELSFGQIPEGKQVLHKCDNPSCCNPNHLFLGSQFDNISDMIQKKRPRYAVGEKSNAKLTRGQVKEIREKYATSNYTYTRLATEYPVSFAQVGNIVRRNDWAWLD